MQCGLTFFGMIGSGIMMLWLSFDWHGMMDHMEFNLGLYCNEENDWVWLLSQHNNITFYVLLITFHIQNYLNQCTVRKMG